MEAAGEIFSEKGFRAATIREITAKAGANVAAVNYYFRDKKELYAAALREALEAAVNESQQIDENLPFEEQLHAFVVERFLLMLNPRRPKWHAGILAHEMGAPTESLDLLVDELLRPKLGPFKKIVAGIAGRVPEKKLTFLLLSVIGQCSVYRQSAALIDRLFPDLLKSPDAIPEIARHVTAFSLAGIRAATSEKAKK